MNGGLLLEHVTQRGNSVEKVFSTVETVHFLIIYWKGSMCLRDSATNLSFWIVLVGVCGG